MTKRQGNLILIVCTLFFSYLPTFAQQDSLIARWAELAEDDVEIIELLQQLADNPINLNRAERNDFTRIPFLNSKHIDQILEYRNQNKLFKSRRPLNKILGTELYVLLKSFFSIRDIRKNNGYLKQKFVYPIDPDPTTQKYQGQLWSSSSKIYFARDKKIKMGIVTQKDVGEPNPLDYFTGYLAYSKSGWQAIAGRYNFRFGHGLAYANPFANQKSAMVLNPLRSLKTSVGPSLSSSENTGLFGACLSSRFSNNLSLTLFGSIQQLDARISRFTDEVIGIDYDGYHRSDSEVDAKNRLTERIIGLSVSKQIIQSLNISLLFSRNQYNPQIQFKQPDVSESDLRRQYYHFSGNRLNQVSAHYDSQIKNVTFSGEACFSDKGSPGYSQKILFLKDCVQFGAAYWWLNKNYQSPHGGVFNHSSTFPQAQQGLYLAMQIKPTKSLTIKAYNFYTKDLWRGYFDTLPQSYKEWFIETSYTILNKSLTLRIRNKTQITASDFHQKIYRLDYAWNPDLKLRIKTRITRTILEEVNENGTYIFQDFKYSLTKQALIYARVTFFQTTSFNSALYEYENDLPGSFANYPLYGQGHKWYLMCRANLGNHFRLWMKLRYLKRTNMDEQTSILSRDLRFQVDWII